MQIISESGNQADNQHLITCCPETCYLITRCSDNLIEELIGAGEFEDVLAEVGILVKQRIPVA